MKPQEYKKAICSYLPYGLELWYSNSEKVRELNYDNIAYAVSIDNIKPLLIPLSKLTEEIEHNGERFVPIDELLKGTKYKFKNIGKSGKFWFKEEGNIMLSYKSENILEWEYSEVQRLLEWHFDIFGLIEKGLAVEK